MKLRWMVLFFPAVFMAGFSILVIRHGAKAAPPQIAAAAAKAAVSVSPAQGGALSIPDTTLAINSPTPMSQRVLHYEIDARYNAAKHTVDATEVLTYHNLTGQTLDHFPFHLYLNGFQPKATWIREAKLLGNRDTTNEKWEDKQFGSE